LIELAREALVEDGQSPAECSLLITALQPSKVLRLAYDAPHTYGRGGARWYDSHHAFARRLSRAFQITVHAYVLDPEELEAVYSYAEGRPVGGEALRYEDDDAFLGGDLDDRAFEKLKGRWPLGHLSKVLGLQRQELIRIPRSGAVALLNLDGSDAPKRLMELFPIAPVRQQRKAPRVPVLPRRNRLRRAQNV
jgi:hypothetical protein